ncbi:MAG: amino acid transporter, family [Thermosediminibacterales bacterium]|nr:amino acid transporter, family [Thermosediminibacterales bacterium]MDK2835328.1 amino acid transporter, family [Thermosediminibacterales bacterium]
MIKDKFKSRLEPKAGKIGILIETKEDVKEEDKLNVWQLTLIGVGGIIGAGFFLATSIAIQHTGPAVLINYLLGGFIMSQVFAALAEMSVANPVSGSFRVYAEEALGRQAGFMSGWMYWIAGVLVMSSEVTASAIFTSYWIPQLPLWITTFIYSLLIIGVNSLGVKEFGTIESWFSIFKLSALIAFIILAALVLLGILPGGPGGLQYYTQYGGFLPHGFRGLLASSLMVLLSFGGVEVTAMAASQTIEPSETVPKAIRNIVTILLTLYLGSIALILAITPWNHITTKASPFVTIFGFIHIPYGGSVMNFVILTAALSTMNAAMYAVTQVLFSLGKGDFAPSIFEKKSKNGVAIYALAASSLGLGLAVVLAYLLPETVYEYITSAAGFVLFFNWIIILLTHIRYRPILEKKFSKELRFKMWGYPYTSWITIFLIGGVLLSTLLSAREMVGFFGGVLIILLLLASYSFAKKLKLL